MFDNNKSQKSLYIYSYTCYVHVIDHLELNIHNIIVPYLPLPCHSLCCMERFDETFHVNGIASRLLSTTFCNLEW